MDFPIVATTGALPATFAESFSQTPSTGYTGNLEAPYLEAGDLLSHYPGLSRSQLERPIKRPALYYAFHLFLNQSTRSEIAMDHPSQQTSLRDLEGSPSEYWSMSPDVPEGSNNPTSPDAVSPQPGMRSTNMMIGTHPHHLMPPYSEVNMPHGTNARPSCSPAGMVSPHSSPRTLMDHPTPSTPSGFYDSDQRLSPISVIEASGLNEETSQSCDSPQSTCRSPPRPRRNSNHMTGVQGSPKTDLKIPAPMPQHGHTSELKMIPWKPDSKSDKWKMRRKSKTPCPKCRKGAFESRHEFIKHMEAFHERHIKFVCNHSILHENGELYCCPRPEWHISAWKKHHTQRHPECTEKQSRHVPSPECRHEIVERPPVRQRGCWLCNHLSLTVEDWVDHHLSRHKACSRSVMSQTQAVKNLLSHRDIRFYWQFQIANLEVTTGYFWNLKWSEDTEDPTMVELMTCLETGFFRDKDFHNDNFVRAQVAEAAMDATIDTRETIAAIPPQQLLELEIGLNSLRRELAGIARPQIDSSPSSMQVQHAATSSALSLYSTMDPAGLCLNTQMEEGSIYSNCFGFIFGEPRDLYLDSED